MSLLGCGCSTVLPHPKALWFHHSHLQENKRTNSVCHVNVKKDQPQNKRHNLSCNCWPVAKRVDVESKLILATGTVWMALQERVHWACFQSHCFSSRARLAVTSSCDGTQQRNITILNTLSQADGFKWHRNRFYLSYLFYLIITAECERCDVLLIILKWTRIRTNRKDVRVKKARCGVHHASFSHWWCQKNVKHQFCLAGHWVPSKLPTFSLIRAKLLEAIQQLFWTHVFHTVDDLACADLQNIDTRSTCAENVLFILADL